MTRLLFIVALVSSLCGPAFAEVERVEVLRRESFAGGMRFGAVGPYEKVVGRLHYRVDPRNPANARIVDLKYAPVDAQGQVHFVGDFILLKPVDLSKGNHRLLYEVNNRGGLAMLARFNLAAGSNDPAAPEHAGNGFLMRQGYSLLWSAWNWDVLPGGGRLQIELPVAIERRRAHHRAASCPRSSWTGAARVSRSPGATAAAIPCWIRTPADSVLTVRDEQRAPRQPIPRTQWRFARDEGGKPVADRGVLVARRRLRARAHLRTRLHRRDPRVVGLGLAAIRDAIAFFRFADKDAGGTPNPLAVDGRRRTRGRRMPSRRTSSASRSRGV